MLSILAFLTSFSFLCFDSTDPTTRLLVGAAYVIVAALIIWCIWYAWESQGHEPLWWKSAFEKLESSESPSDHTEDGDEQHFVDGEASPGRSWRWITMLRAKRAFVDSARTTV